MVPACRSMALVLVTAASTWCTSRAANAQCGLQWQPGELPGADVFAYAAVAWDPDGNGPQTALVVVGGAFTAIGGMPANHIAFYDPTNGQWGTFGAGMDGTVTSLAVGPNGELFAGGGFWSSNGAFTPKVARFDGTAWRALGNSGPNGFVWDIALAANGDLIAGGEFTAAGNTAASSVARWDGTNWHALGSGIGGNPLVRAVAVHPNGDIFVGGDFTLAGGVSASRIARWDGSSWSSLGTGVSTSGYAGVYSLLVLPNGDLVAGGTFGTIGGIAVAGIARWDGASWSAIGNPYIDRVWTLGVRANGNLVAGGGNNLAEWNGSSWSHPWGSLSGASAMGFVEHPNGDLLLVGEFTSVAGVMAYHLAHWNGTGWSAVVAANSFDAAVTSLTARANGDLIALGAFTRVGAVAASKVARWDGTSWGPIAGLSGLNISGGIAQLPNGDLVLGEVWITGGFLRWDGTTVTPFAAPLSWYSTRMLAALPNGDLIAAGGFTVVNGVNYRGIARWDGVAWQSLAGGVNGSVSAVLVTSTGHLIVSGTFTSAGTTPALNIARWNGTQWSALGAGLPRAATTMAELPDGDLVVAGSPTAVLGGTPDLINRWDGAQWHPMAHGFWGAPSDLEVLANGDLIACGNIVWVNTSQPAFNIARWSGSSWTPVGQGFRWGLPSSSAQLPGGDLVFGGSFLNAGGHGSAYFARLASNCPAIATSVGSPCAGGAGPLTLTAVQLPWLGSTCRSVASGLAANGLAFGIAGLAPTNVPLATFHPAAGPNCSVFTSIGATLWLPVVNGLATLNLPIPSDPGLVGTMLFQQVVQAELDAAWNITSLSSSNALQLTLGAQ